MQTGLEGGFGEFFFVDVCVAAGGVDVAVIDEDGCDFETNETATAFDFGVTQGLGTEWCDVQALAAPQNHVADAIGFESVYVHHLCFVASQSPRIVGIRRDGACCQMRQSSAVRLVKE